MDYKDLGRLGLRASRVAFGTMNFGMVTDEATSFAIMDRALEDGITLRNRRRLRRPSAARRSARDLCLVTSSQGKEHPDEHTHTRT